ncbi:tryptophan synthase beta subunit-like PLP-dependent enzyme [Pelagophyceae sp. CCMP2097]|nr:tryptophan synthase beta subunit-like PLP-dependent enzyme [Pelagophyceae sp. CCMP2097]
MVLDRVVFLLVVGGATAVWFGLSRRRAGLRLCWSRTPPAPLPPGYGVTAARVSAAALRVSAHVHRTPVLTCSHLDARSGRQLFFKCEVLQRTGSFKIRGATNAALLAPPGAPLVTHSSGNHAQALALAAKSTGRAAHVVMPETAAATKRAAVAGYGAAISLCAPTNAAREAAAARVCAAVGGHFVHPSNDCDVIAGQGTVACEFLAQVKDLDALIVPVGGGGLISGIAVFAKAATRGRIKIIGAEPRNVDDAARSKAAGKLLGFGPTDDVPDTLADGLKTLLGSNTWPVVRDLVDDVITVEEAEIAEATRLVWSRMKLCIEPSAGVGVAVALSDRFSALYPPAAFPRVGVILCGGNLDLTKAAAGFLSQ